MKEETVWYGYLEAGQKSTPVVLDRRLHTGHNETVYLFNFAREEILEYQCRIVEQKLQELKPDQAHLLKQLKAAYSTVRRNFRARRGQVLHFPEHNPSGRARLEKDAPREFAKILLKMKNGLTRAR